MRYATQKLKDTVASLATNPRELAPGQYQWYVPSWGDYIGSAVNRLPRWVAKGSYSVKNLSTTEDRSKAMDPEVKKLVEQALDKHED